MVELRMLRGRYFAGLDLMRLIASIAIVYLHAVGGTSLAATSTFTRFAVPFFTASAVLFAYLESIRETPPSTWSYLRKRFSRIYLPFLVWTLIYLALRSVGSIITSTPWPSVGVWTLWTGTAHHLWFLPFIFFATSAVFFVSRFVERSQCHYLASIVAILLGITCSLDRPRFISDLGYTASLSYNTAPALFWTWGVSVWFSRRGLPRINRKWSVILGTAIFITLLAVLEMQGRIMVLENLSGIAALILAMLVTIDRPKKWVAIMGGFAYGIYLCHIAWIETIQDILAIANINETWALTIAVFLFALGGSIAFCIVVSRLPGSWLLGIPPRYKKHDNR